MVRPTCQELKDKFGGEIIKGQRYNSPIGWTLTGREHWELKCHTRGIYYYFNDPCVGKEKRLFTCSGHHNDITRKMTYAIKNPTIEIIEKAIDSTKRLMDRWREDLESFGEDFSCEWYQCDREYKGSDDEV